MPPKGATKAKAKAANRRSTGGTTLSELLDRFREDPTADEQMLAVASTAWESAQKSYGFDKSATSTQNRRKRHLEEYEKVVEGIAKLAGETEIDEETLWGADNIESNLRQYIAMAAQLIVPRKFTSASMKFQTLLQRRQSMIYWIQKNCKGVETKRMWNASQEALHSSFREHNVATEPTPKAYLTKFDLVKLIEHDMYNSVDSAVSQQHHLVWLLGFICGVRPGTIGTSRHHMDQFLSWGDISITRAGGQSSNNFKATINFKWLKGYRDVEAAAKPLVFTCNGPQDPEDVMFSIPHRLLGILLDRQYLVDYSTLSQLLGDNKLNIKIKDSAKKLPVVLAAGNKGMGLLDTPASCDAISAYVQRRAIDYGLPSGITHYAWRRSAGTKVAESAGADKAREFLGHEVGTRTFETSYNQGLVAFDAVAIALGRQKQSNDELLEDTGVVVNRIVQATESQQKWIEKFIQDDEAYKAQDIALQAADLEAA